MPDPNTPAGSLVLVATPIGNLGDLSPRAVEALSSASLICAEDTRRVAKLFSHSGIRAPRLAVANEHTERHRISDVLETLGAGGDVVLVSDAGTPGISDPGAHLVSAVIDAGYEVTTVPGPVAAVAALVVSGIDPTRFVFEGFLPRSGAARTRRIAAVAAEQRTVVLYEAPHRVRRTVAELAEACGRDRRAALVRELTKRFEEVRRGTLGELEPQLDEPRGEYVIVLAGAPAVTEPPDDDTIRSALRDELGGGASRRDAASAVARRLGIPRRTAYALAVGEGTQDQ